MIINKCKTCGKDVETYPSLNRQFCSKACFYANRKRETFDRLKKICVVCGSVFIPKHSKSPGFCCSYKCIGVHRTKERVERSGYWYVFLPGHHRSIKQGYVAEHIIIMEKVLGRDLLQCETVHHINKNRKDNSIENLKLMMISEHRRHHMLESIIAGKMNHSSQIKNRCRKNGKFI